MISMTSRENPGTNRGVWFWFKDQFSILPLVGDYFIPEETNSIWYSLGGVLALALVLQVVSGIILTLKYIPDAGLAYSVVSDMIGSRFWGITLGFHYFNSFLIFGLMLVHLMRVFVTAAYRGSKKGLWFTGVSLAILLFAAYVTGESLHWDEVGFAVPWHISEIFQATGLSGILGYNFSDLLSIPSATVKLVQIYALHVAILPLLILLLIFVHFYLIKTKGISLPFWKTPSGRKVSFGTHIKRWLIYTLFMCGAMLLLAIFVGRDLGTAPQLLSSSPLYGAHKGPGGLGYKPSSPIGWTHGMNVFVEHLGLKPDIWGTVIAMALMLVSLIAVPFVDREEKEPVSFKEAFDWRKRKWAFIAIALFWAVMIVGVIQNAIAGPG